MKDECQAPFWVKKTEIRAKTTNNWGVDLRIKNDASA
jgi:hypothetical protein